MRHKRVIVETGNATCPMCRKEHFDNEPDSKVEPAPVDYFAMYPEDMVSSVRWYACGHIFYTRKGTGEFRYLSFIGQAS